MTDVKCGDQPDVPTSPPAPDPRLRAYIDCDECGIGIEIVMHDEDPDQCPLCDHGEISDGYVAKPSDLEWNAA